MHYEGMHEVPEIIDCPEVIRKGGRIKAGLIEGRELENDEEIRVSIRSSRFPSVELFTLRNVEPDNYLLVLVAIPRVKRA